MKRILTITVLLLIFIAMLLLLYFFPGIAAYGTTETMLMLCVLVFSVNGAVLLLVQKERE